MIIAKQNLKKLNICIEYLEKIFEKKIIIDNHHKIDLPGVYIIHDSNFNIIYVGESKNIYKRLSNKKHIFNESNYQVVSLIIHNDNFRWSAETILIASLRPFKNKINFLYGSVRKRGKN